MELTADQQREREVSIDAIFDRLSPMQLMAEICEAVGRTRAVELVGWAILWNISGQSDPVALRMRLLEAGQSRSASYRALDDFRQIGTYLLEKHGWNIDAPAAATLLRRIGVKMASAN